MLFQDMWKLEDRIEGSEYLASRGSERNQGASSAPDASSDPENQGKHEKKRRRHDNPMSNRTHS